MQHEQEIVNLIFTEHLFYARKHFTYIISWNIHNNHIEIHIIIFPMTQRRQPRLRNIFLKH